MNCPDCLNQLTEVEFRQIKIQECVSCQGRWFDRKELSKAKDNTDDDLRWLDFDPFDKTADKFAVPPEGKVCPCCHSAMDSLTYVGSGVVIDRCKKCEGIWVHHGEFEKIIHYLEEVVATKSSPEYLRDTLKQFLEIAQGKEDFAEELKDFLVVLKLSEKRIGAEHPHIGEAIKKILEYLPFV